MPYAILSPTQPMGGGLRLFYKYPEEYLRTELPMKGLWDQVMIKMFGISDTIATGIVMPLFYPNYSLTPISVIVDSTTFVIPANGILIFGFDQDRAWYADYTVNVSSCPFCGGTGITNDITFDKLGNLSLVYNVDKIAQLVMKAIATERGKNPFFPNYGTDINNLIGQKTGKNAWVLRSELLNQVTFLKEVQDAINTTRPNFLTPGECLEGIIGIELNETNGGMGIEIKVNLLCRTMERVSTKPLVLQL